MARLRIQHSASWVSRPPEVVIAMPNHQRVILQKDDGSEVVVFTGENFSEEEFLKLRDKYELKALGRV